MYMILIETFISNEEGAALLHLQKFNSEENTNKNLQRKATQHLKNFRNFSKATMLERTVQRVERRNSVGITLLLKCLESKIRTYLKYSRLE